MMFKRKLKDLTILSLVVQVSACSLDYSSLDSSENSSTPNLLNFQSISPSTRDFSTAGTITLSFPISHQVVEGKDAYTLANTELNQSENIFKNEDLGTSLLSNSDVPDANSSEAEDAKKEIKEHYSKVDFAPLLGFIPIHASFKPADNEIWIELERQSSTFRLYKGKERLKEIKGQGTITLAPGEYPLQHKQKEALWYAPDEYFEKRQLRVPPRGDHFRYRRGALGNYALYPTMDFIIHSGPFFSEEIGGLKLSDSDLSEIFSVLSVGTQIVVK